MTDDIPRRAEPSPEVPFLANGIPDFLLRAAEKSRPVMLRCTDGFTLTGLVTEHDGYLGFQQIKAGGGPWDERLNRAVWWLDPARIMAAGYIDPKDYE